MFQATRALVIPVLLFNATALCRLLQSFEAQRAELRRTKFVHSDHGTIPTKAHFFEQLTHLRPDVALHRRTAGQEGVTQKHKRPLASL